MLVPSAHKILDPLTLGFLIDLAIVSSAGNLLVSNLTKGLSLLLLVCIVELESIPVLANEIVCHLESNLSRGSVHQIVTIGW